MGSDEKHSGYPNLMITDENVLNAAFDVLASKKRNAITMEDLENHPIGGQYRHEEIKELVRELTSKGKFEDLNKVLGKPPINVRVPDQVLLELADARGQATNRLDSQLLDALKDKSPLLVSDLAKRLGCPILIVEALARTMMARGYVTFKRAGMGQEYQVGLRRK